MITHLNLLNYQFQLDKTCVLVMYMMGKICVFVIYMMDKTCVFVMYIRYVLYPIFFFVFLIQHWWWLFVKMRHLYLHIGDTYLLLVTRNLTAVNFVKSLVTCEPYNHHLWVLVVTCIPYSRHLCVLLVTCEIYSRHHCKSLVTGVHASLMWFTSVTKI